MAARGQRTPHRDGEMHRVSVAVIVIEIENEEVVAVGGLAVTGPCNLVCNENSSRAIWTKNRARSDFDFFP